MWGICASYFAKYCTIFSIHIPHTVKKFFFWGDCRSFFNTFSLFHIVNESVPSFETIISIHVLDSCGCQLLHEVTRVAILMAGMCLYDQSVRVSPA